MFLLQSHVPLYIFYILKILREVTLSNNVYGTGITLFFLYIFAHRFKLNPLFIQGVQFKTLYGLLSLSERFLN